MPGGIAEWDDTDLYRDATASRAFPVLAQQVKSRWSMGGIVGESVNEHVSEAREDEGFRRGAINGFILAAGVLATVVSGGTLGAIAIAGLSATAREGVNVERARDASERTTGRALAGLASAEEAENAHSDAVATSRVAALAVAADMVAAGAIAQGHHALSGQVSQGARRAVDVGAAAADAAAAVTIEQGAHAVTAAVTHGDH